jgi:hypothetical protein
MKTTSLRVVPWAGLLLLPLSVALAAQTVVTVPDPCPPQPLTPNAAKAGPPAWLHPGTRITFFNESATILAAGKFVLDEQGNWVEKGTGRKIPGIASGGAAYTVFHAGYVDRDLVELSSSMYLLDAAANTVTPAGGGGLVTNPGCAGDMWIHPDELKKIPANPGNGVTVTRMPYIWQDHRYPNALRVQTTTDTGYTAYVYDLDTGLTVFHGSSTASVTGTTLVTGWMVERKDIDVPWKAAPVPAWVAKFRELDYQGAQSTSIPGAGQMDQPSTAVLTVKTRGDSWVRYTSKVEVAAPGGLMAPQQAQMEWSCGTASIGGLWIAPEALAKLKTGQAIERNDAIKTVTSVRARDSPLGPISEVGQLHRLDAYYDLQSGILARTVNTTQSGVATITQRSQLVQQK